MKTKIVILTVAVLALTYCKSKQETTSTASTTVKEETLPENLKAAAEARYPGVAAADIQEGSKLYVTRCGKCHGLPEVASITEDKWPGIMKWMAPKANMDDAQREKTLKYVLAARDLATKK